MSGVGITTKEINLEVDQSEIDRFLERIDRSAGPDGCWPIRGGSRGPLGHVKINFAGQRVLAHRLSFLLGGGVLTPDKPLVIHSCHHGWCQNHLRCLRAGSALENARDRDLAGRRRPARGASSPVAKLSQREAEAVRRMHAQGVRAEIVAEAFEISRSLVFSIVKGSAYQLEGPAPFVQGRAA